MPAMLDVATLKVRLIALQDQLVRHLKPLPGELLAPELLTFDDGGPSASGFDPQDAHSALIVDHWIRVHGLLHAAVDADQEDARSSALAYANAVVRVLQGVCDAGSTSDGRPL